MKQSSRKILAAVLMVVLIGSIGLRLWQQHSDRFAAEAYNRAEELLQAVPPSEIENTEPPKADLPELWVPAPVEDDPYLEELRRTDLSALKEVNPDVVGWISIPGTVINFPLLQGSDNHYYLKYTWDNQRSNVGAIILTAPSTRCWATLTASFTGTTCLTAPCFLRCCSMPTRSITTPTPIFML